MESYKYDLHVHTREGSACGRASGAEIAEAAAQQGYAGLVITDHFFNGNTTAAPELSWQEKVQVLKEGYLHAKQRGEQLGLEVFFGWEFGYSGSDFLTYGLDTDWLLAHPDVHKLPLYDYLQLVRQAGGMTIHAHPFREAWYVHVMRLVPELEDAVEVYNTSHQNPAFNARAAWYAEAYGLTGVSGSDAHSQEALKGGVLLPHPVHSIRELMTAIRNREMVGLCMGTEIEWKSERRDRDSGRR